MRHKGLGGERYLDLIVAELSKICVLYNSLWKNNLTLGNVWWWNELNEEEKNNFFVENYTNNF